ncbi:hypothetical protein CPB97_009987 [Podila verticillata]|nr:hypothetical protein CPB97_009987 [Podila verticillata]
MLYKTILLLYAASFVVANTTVHRPSDYSKNRDAPGDYAGGATLCNTYHDCARCGLYERCCQASTPLAIGYCRCGVNSYPQGTCF